MYIKVGVGNIDNKVDFNCVDYNYDENPICYYDYGTQSIKQIDETLTGNYGVRTYPIMDSEGTLIASGAICLFSDSQVYTSAPSSNKDFLKEPYQSLIENSGFGVFDNEQDAIISKRISYTNRVSGGWWSSSLSNVEYTEVTPTETAPENWEEERLYAYYLGYAVGVTDAQKLYVHTQITPANYDWETLYTYLQNNPSFKLYKNTELSKRIIIGDDEHCVSFNVTKCDLTHGTYSYQYPFVGRFSRNANTAEARDSGGVMIAGDDPTDVPFVLWDVNSNPFATTGWNFPTTQTTFHTSPFSETGRLNASAPPTKANPVTECTLMQFGRVKFKGKTYIGVWNIVYKSAYYWGYLSTNTLDQYNPTSWSTLSATAVTYGADMNKEEHVQNVSFFGVCLEDIDVTTDITEGDIPTPPTPGPSGGGEYSYPSATHPMWGTEWFGTISDFNATGFHVYWLSAEAFEDLTKRLYQWEANRWSTKNLLTDNLTAYYDDNENTDKLNKLLSLAQIIVPSLNLAQDATDLYSNLKDYGHDIKSGLLFVRKMPLFVSDFATTLPAFVPFKIAGIDLNLNGLCLYIDIERIADSVEYVYTFEKSNAMKFQTKTFYDLSPYVTATLFLPYYGEVSLPVDSFLGGSLRIKYCADVVSGKGGALVIAKDHNGKETTFGPYLGNVSVDIPTAAGDVMAGSRFSSIANTATSTAVNALSGNVSGAAVSGITGIISAAGIPKTQQMITTLGDGNGFLTPKEIMLQLTYPQTLDDKDAKKNIEETISNIGVASYQNGKVSEFLTTDKITKFSYVNTDGISQATEAEKREIERLMREGVY